MNLKRNNPKQKKLWVTEAIKTMDHAFYISLMAILVANTFEN